MTYNEFKNKSTALGYRTKMHLIPIHDTWTILTMGVLVEDYISAKVLGAVIARNPKTFKTENNVFKVYGKLSDQEVQLMNHLAQTPVSKRH